jgi:WD40 repeat protein/DNA-binding winged helix-turn-helix (wHTH) protein
MSFWFGDFELDQERRQLLRAGEPVPLEPKAYELLSLLLERRPKALSRAQIRDVVWPGTSVSESALAVAVNGIRHALGDDARQPRFIRTVHGFGYAFCGEAQTAGDGGAATADAVRERSPYPGLSAFTEADAEQFFGREAEVEALWEKIRRRKLLAVIGPSGVGKTSFVRAGVIARRPAGWRVAYVTPGTNPVSALARALVPDLAGDAGAIGELLQAVEELNETGEPGHALSAIREWRKESAEALVVVDQLEELFTLNAKEVQSRFTSFLGHLAGAPSVRVLLSLRDDFLVRCGEGDGLRPVFEELTPLYPPSPDALRRAVAEPARRVGYRFEEDALVEEMVEAVASERGALPLLAFAVSRLWEERAQDRKLLTREAYRRIEGVAGALAQHAEATLSRLGPGREGIVREIFRNLVTAQATRAVADRAELLSVFGKGQDEAGSVLDALVDARLLTEYEADETRPGRGPSPGPDGGTAAWLPDETSRRRVEIVHESLLTHWPRLARWMTQDADGAQLRDQLRQAAHLWDERGRRDDLLWRGASYMDYRAWRARYAVGLSTLEQEFARSMTALAERQRRRRRLAVAAVVSALGVGLGVVGVLWTRSEVARRQAGAEALRAEASQLLALGQAELDKDPTAALAYATKSLDLVDTPEGRLLALRILQDGPTALVAPVAEPNALAFDSSGRWLAAGSSRQVRLLNRDGREPVVMEGDYPSPSWLEFGPEGRVLVAESGGDLRLWSVPDGRQVKSLKVEEGQSRLFVPNVLRFLVGREGHGLYTSTTTTGGREIVRWAPLAGGELRLVGAMAEAGTKALDVAGTHLAYVPGALWTGRKLFVRRVEDWTTPPRLVATHPADIVGISFHPGGRQIAAADKSGSIRVWSADGRSERPLRVLESPGVLGVTYGARGRWLAARGAGDEGYFAYLWDLTAPRSIQPLRVRISRAYGDWVLDPSERWLASVNWPEEIRLHPIEATYPRFAGRHDWFVDDVAFTPDGSTLVSVSGGSDGTVRARSLSPDDDGGERVLLRASFDGPRLAMGPRGERVVVSAWPMARVFVVPLSGGSALELRGFTHGYLYSVAFSPSGSRVAAAILEGPVEEKVVRIWDLDDGQQHVLGPLPGAGEGPAGGVASLEFVDDDRLVYGGPSGVFLIDRRRAGPSRVSARPTAALAVDRRHEAVFAVVQEPDELVRVDLRDSSSTPIFPCARCASVGVDSAASVVAAGSDDGIVRIGPAAGGEPHLFLSPIGGPQRVAFSPDGRWVASSGERDHVRLWPVPDVTRTPLHERSHEELLATLHSWTNLRAVSDTQSPSGWRLEPSPFPGWEKLPTR